MAQQVKVTSDVKGQLKKCLKEIFNEFKEQCNPGEKFTVAVSGASLVDQLAGALVDLTDYLTDDDWNRWLILFVDERLVPTDDPQSTHGCYLRSLSNWNKIVPSQFIGIDESLSPHECAADYENKLKEVLPVVQGKHFPSLIVSLLGFGPDGHTASLFPGHDLLLEKNKWVAAITDSPKPPPSRVTLTLPMIQSSKNILIVATGSSKADIVSRVINDGEGLPIGLATNGSSSVTTVTWILDPEAGREVSQNSLGSQQLSL